MKKESSSSIWLRLIKVVVIFIFGIILFFQIFVINLYGYTIYTIIIFGLFWWAIYYVSTGDIFPKSFFENE